MNPKEKATAEWQYKNTKSALAHLTGQLQRERHHALRTNMKQAIKRLETEERRLRFMLAME